MSQVSAREVSAPSRLHPGSPPGREPQPLRRLEQTPGSAEAVLAIPTFANDKPRPAAVAFQRLLTRRQLNRGAAMTLPGDKETGASNTAAV